jgi:hypothetical protein
MIADVKKSAEQKMQKSVEALKVDLGKSVPAGHTPVCSTISRSTITGR